MTLVRGATLVLAAITLGLSAGMFYTYPASVMLGWLAGGAFEIALPHHA